MDNSVPVLTTKNLNHLGIVAATLRDNRIGERIDLLLGEKRQVTSKVSLGQCVSAMIINGLGFANRALYLVSRFFVDKPVQLLLGPGVEAEDLNDDTLGKCLDIIADYDPTHFFANIAFPIALELKQVGRYRWMDSTSFSLEGDYSGWEADEENPPQLIRVAHGFSKAGRPDLKQVMMSLVMVGPAGLPIWAEPQDGNSSDKKTFHDIRQRTNEFSAQFQPEADTCWVADSAFYSKERLLSPEVQDFWITRVPETVTEAKKLVTRNIPK
jgi:transposase